MLDTMTADQYVDWFRYDALHPIGDLRTEMEFARLKYLIVSAIAGTEGTLLDFMWTFFQDDESREVASKAQVADKVKKAFGL